MIYILPVDMQLLIRILDTMLTMGLTEPWSRYYCSLFGFINAPTLLCVRASFFVQPMAGNTKAFYTVQTLFYLGTLFWTFAIDAQVYFPLRYLWNCLYCPSAPISWAVS